MLLDVSNVCNGGLVGVVRLVVITYQEIGLLILPPCRRGSNSWWALLPGGWEDEHEHSW